MKHLFLSLIAIIASMAFCANAETLYLKNGSILTGKIVEEVPGVSLKIKTRDGNIFHYQLSEIDKISRDQTSGSWYFPQNGDGVQTGYRGFVDFGYTIGVGNISAGRLELTTSHGYQVCPYFFAGVGAGLNYYTDGSLFSVPLFADLRADLLNNRITPFVDFKIGYSVADVDGFYMSPSIGCRLGVSPNLAFNLSIGYTMQKTTVSYIGYGYYSGYYVFEDTGNVGGVSIKLGVEF